MVPSVTEPFASDLCQGVLHLLCRGCDRVHTTESLRGACGRSSRTGRTYLSTRLCAFRPFLGLVDVLLYPGIRHPSMKTISAVVHFWEMNGLVV